MLHYSMLYLILEWSAWRSRAFRGKNIPKIDQNWSKICPKLVKFWESKSFLLKIMMHYFKNSKLFRFGSGQIPANFGRSGLARANPQDPKRPKIPKFLNRFFLFIMVPGYCVTVCSLQNIPSFLLFLLFVYFIIIELDPDFVLEAWKTWIENISCSFNP